MVRVNIKPTTPLDPMFREGYTMTTPKFLPKDPTKALIEVKEMLYDRLTVLKQCIPHSHVIGYEFDAVEKQMINEVDFLEGVLDIIERS